MTTDRNPDLIGPILIAACAVGTTWNGVSPFTTSETLIRVPVDTSVSLSCIAGVPARATDGDSSIAVFIIFHHFYVISVFQYLNQDTRKDTDIGLILPDSLFMEDGDVGHTITPF
jgi:hypothetical protein